MENGIMMRNVFAAAFFVFVMGSISEASARLAEPLPAPGSGTVSTICFDVPKTDGTRTANYCSQDTCNKYNADGDARTRCDKGILAN